MKFRLILASAALALAPALATAQDCSKNRGQTVMSCADGFVLDATTGACIEKATS
ncbi:hypothetical protein [Oceaniovalibus sp. ACAM 378]|uniref:hypothetical protein n=1 Tax=Oceaniovalibus sp. ACAM 378 TaxID=2599923 RepID=UPI0016523685|nr:hypothetical protein [Oceaniovalibus sp. ACAM 378]